MYNLPNTTTHKAGVHTWSEAPGLETGPQATSRLVQRPGIDYPYPPVKRTSFRRGGVGMQDHEDE